MRVNSTIMSRDLGILNSKTVEPLSIKPSQPPEQSNFKTAKKTSPKKKENPGRGFNTAPKEIVCINSSSVDEEDEEA